MEPSCILGLGPYFLLIKGKGKRKYILEKKRYKNKLEI